MSWIILAVIIIGAVIYFYMYCDLEKDGILDTIILILFSLCWPVWAFLVGIYVVFSDRNSIDIKRINCN